MSAQYTGNGGATQAPSPPPGQSVNPIVKLPSDGDPLNAASVAQMVKVLADFAAYLTGHAAIQDGTNSFSGDNTFGPLSTLLLGGAATVPNGGTLTFANGSTAAFQAGSSTTISETVVADGPSNPSSPLFDSTVGMASGHRRCLWKIRVGAGLSSFIRIYSEGNWFLEFVFNAAWDDTNQLWNRDTLGLPACKSTFYAAGLRISSQTAGGPDSWADNAWVHNNAVDIDTISSFISMAVGGNITLTSTAGLATIVGAGGASIGTASTGFGASALGTARIDHTAGCLAVSAPSMTNANVSFGGAVPFDAVVSIAGHNTRGSVSVKRNAGGDTSLPNIQIAFVGAPLSTVPVVVASPTQVGSDVFPVSVDSVTANGFVVVVGKSANTGNYPSGGGVATVGFNWVALQ